MVDKPIQFVDLGAQHAEIARELDDAIRQIIASSSFIGGHFVEAFENAFATFVGVPHVIGLASGTDAVRIALQIAGVKRDDAVVTVSHTFIGTTEGVEHIGGRPVFVDVDRQTRTMSPAALATFLEDRCARDRAGVLRQQSTGRRIGALLPVHLYGQSADMAPILELGERFGVPVVEDAAQAQGAVYRFPDGREALCGSMGVAAAFSFYPGKNLGAMGEAGAVATTDPARARMAILLRDHGQSKKYVHEIAHGTNARLDAIQAAVLSIKLRRLDAWNANRRRAAERYTSGLQGARGLALPLEAPYASHIYHLYVVQTPERDRLRTELAEAGIATGLHYPIPLHLQPAYAGQDVVGGPLPNTEWAAQTCLSLPMHPHLDEQQVDRVVSALETCLLREEGAGRA